MTTLTTPMPKAHTMSATGSIRAFLLAAPLAFAALLLWHPVGEGSFSSFVLADDTRFLVVHLGAAVLFPLMAFVIWLQIRGVPGRAATISRIALPVFAVFYGTWEALTGIASGVLAHEANATSGVAREAIAGTIDTIASHPIVGELGVLNSIGALAWIVAVSAAIVALSAAGVRRAALILLGIGALMVMHVPPIGPVALVCLSAAGLLVERRRPLSAG